MKGGKGRKEGEWGEEKRMKGRSEIREEGKETKRRKEEVNEKERRRGRIE